MVNGSDRNASRPAAAHERTVSRSADIAADPATIFDVLADPGQHPLFDGSDSVKGRTSGPPRLFLGAQFSMRMRIGLPYLIANTVIEYDEDRRIAWRHFDRHVWRYELEPTDDGPTTKVTETFDWAPSLAPRLLELVHFPERNTKAIEATLQRLKALVESRLATPRGSGGR
jgi:uncharacterized protein YndB with AHSA1/START domain